MSNERKMGGSTAMESDRSQRMPIRVEKNNCGDRYLNEASLSPRVVPTLASTSSPQPVRFMCALMPRVEQPDLLMIRFRPVLMRRHALVLASALPWASSSKLAIRPDMP